MAKQYDVNTIISAAGGAESIWRLVAVLIAAGWSKVADSDGTTYSSSGTQVTGYGSGANGLNNALAWVRMREPGGRREWMFQRATSTNEHQWRVLFSANAKFSGGSPGATQTPSATDERVLLGAGTHASPTFAQLFPSGGGYRCHAIAQDAPVGNAYGFWLACTTTPAGAGVTCVFQEPMAAGSYPAEDVDPAVYACRYAASAAWSTSVTPLWWEAYGLGGQAARAVPPNTLGGVAQALGTHAANGKDTKLPMSYMTTSAAWKGHSAHARWKTISARAYPDTVDLTTDALVYLDNWAIPWPENVAPVL